MPGMYTTGMEKTHHGNGVNDNASPSGYSLDYASFLDGADSALQQQLYQYLQGPSVHRENHPGQVEEVDGFTNGTPLYQTGAASFEAGPSHFQSMPVEPLQARTDVVQQSILDGSLCHSGHNGGRISEYATNSDAGRSIRKHIKAIGTSTPGCLQQLSPLGTFLPHRHLYSTNHQPGSNFECGVSQAPGRPKLVDASGSPSVYIPRERSGYETSCSPNSLKRTRSELVIPQSRTFRGPNSQVVDSGPKTSFRRPNDQAGHIIRERQRRDDMTNKFLILESLLPPGPKRDRSTVVDDSVEYVKNLHQRLKDTQKRRADILKAHAALSSEVLTVHTPKQNNRATCHNLSSPDLRKVAVNAAFIRTSPESKEIDSDAKKKASCIDNIQVHVDLPHQIVIEMTCRSHPHIQRDRKSVV